MAQFAFELRCVVDNWDKSILILKSFPYSNDLDKGVLKWLVRLFTGKGKPVSKISSGADDVDKLNRLRDVSRHKKGRLTDISERLGKLEQSQIREGAQKMSSDMGTKLKAGVESSLSRGPVKISDKEIAENKIRRAVDKEIKAMDDAAASSERSAGMLKFLKDMGIPAPKPPATTGIRRAVPVKVSLEKKPKQSKEFLKFIKQIGIQKRN